MGSQRHPMQILIQISKGGCTWVLLGCQESTANYEIFAIGALMGGSAAAMTIASLTLVAKLVGNDLGTIHFNFTYYIDWYDTAMVLQIHISMN